MAAKTKTSVIAFHKKYLMSLASEVLNMRDVDIAAVFNTTKQNVSLILNKVADSKKKK